jgi:thioredoxin reductase (NADPH)
MAGGVAAGGQLTTTTDVENYPGFPDGVSGPELMMNMREQSINSGCEIITKTVDRVEFSDNPLEVPHVVHVGNDTYLAKAVIISTGATAKRL